MTKLFNEYEYQLRVQRQRRWQRRKASLVALCSAIGTCTVYGGLLWYIVVNI